MTRRTNLAQRWERASLCSGQWTSVMLPLPRTKHHLLCLLRTMTAVRQTQRSRVLWPMHVEVVVVLGKEAEGHVGGRHTCFVSRAVAVGVKDGLVARSQAGAAPVVVMTNATTVKATAVTAAAAAMCLVGSVPHRLRTPTVAATSKPVQVAEEQQRRRRRRRRRETKGDQTENRATVLVPAAGAVAVVPATAVAAVTAVLSA